MTKEQIREMLMAIFNQPGYPMRPFVKLNFDMFVDLLYNSQNPYN
jgi:hypothetical protein